MTVTSAWRLLLSGARAALLCLLVIGAAAGSAFASATPAQIDESIRKGKQYLYEQQKDGNWEDVPKRNPTSRPSSFNGGQWGMQTALAVQALLAAGDSHEEPHVKAGIEFLKKAELVGVCAVGMRAAALNRVPITPEIRAMLIKDLAFLRKAIKTRGKAKGFYDFLDTGREDDPRFDHRTSLYGALGVWACAQNIEVPDEYWRLVDAAWRSTQESTGGWQRFDDDRDENPETVAMTSAGITTLFVCDDMLSRSRSLAPAGNPRDDQIDKGVRWIRDNFNSMFQRTSKFSPHPEFSLWCIERIGAASGRRYLGDIDWYDAGAEQLVKTQWSTGAWREVADTSFALMFLSSGRSTVAVAKLDYSDPARSDPAQQPKWNQRPRDAANMVKFISRQAERNLNWQVVNLRAPVKQLLDSPILYLSGNEEFKPTQAEFDALKQYVEAGGLLVAHADASSKLFAKSFSDLARRMFGSYEFRPLPENHVIFTDEQFASSRWKRKPAIVGMSNGVRELALLLPDGDPAKYWQAYDVGGHPEAFELMADVFQYSIDKQNLRNRGDAYVVEPDPNVKPKSSIKLARLKYDGNWDPEPGGWRREAAILNNYRNTKLDLSVVEVAKLATTDAKIAHLTGTGPVKFDELSQDAIKAFTDQGGVLIVDAAGGSPAFAQTIQSSLETIFADEAKSLQTPVAAEHPIYRVGAKFAIEYRPFAIQTLKADAKGGRIRMIERAGKPLVIFSAEDLSEGLVGQQVDGIVGYTPKTCSNLMTNLILYANGARPPAQTPGKK